MALVKLSVVEQRYRAVLQVLAGVPVVEVAEDFGVSRQSVHAWVRRYRADGLGGLMDRSRRPELSPSQIGSLVEVAICELRRGHPRWGPRRIRYELGRRRMDPVPARSTVYRVLIRHGLIEPRSRRRRREDYRRWERDTPMALWQMDIVGGVMIGGSGGEAKVVTGVDDHSRFCVIAKVVPRATGRAVCLAFAEALRRFGVPDEVLSDNGKQFTARFGRGGEVLFDRICRDNGIAHRLTQPASPTTTGKVERFHQTLRRELLDDAGVFATVADAQAALDDWVAEYNGDRPHQSLDMAMPASRFRPGRDRVTDHGELLPLRLPAGLETVVDAGVATPPAQQPQAVDKKGEDAGRAVRPAVWAGGPIEFERVVPSSGNMWLANRQFWLGPARAGLTVTFWADVDIIHLLIAGSRIKTLRSHLSTADLGALVAHGARPAGPPPLPGPGTDQTIEVDRLVNRFGAVSLKARHVLAAEILAGRQVTVRIEPGVLMFFDPSTRELLRTRPNPGLTLEQAQQLRGARPAGPPPRPRQEPVTVQRRASATGTITVARQTVSLGRPNAGRMVTVHAAETTLTIELDGQTKTVRRTTTKPITHIKGQRPRTVSNFF